MRPTALKACALALIASAAAAHAQTTVGPADIEVSFYLNGNNFIVDPPGPDPSTAMTQVSGFNVLNVDGYGQVYDFCADFFTGKDETTKYTITSGLGSLSATQQAEVKDLMSNAVPIFNAMLSAYIAQVGQGNWDGDPAQRAHIDAYGAGIQMALWEIVNDTSGVLQLDASKPNSGIFATDLTASASASVLEAENDGVTMVNNIRNGVWTNQGGLNYLYADSPDQQDRIWVQAIPVPESSSALLAFAGSSLLLRRRRK